jgi:hypothetical protein
MRSRECGKEPLVSVNFGNILTGLGTFSLSKGIFTINLIK